ncbi:MAG: Rrf2 family transcriptional regulator [Acidobacteria bacterium]|nr:Rrf2 family transcriptional regulator [Acidobacteriota bacterium]
MPDPFPPSFHYAIRALACLKPGGSYLQGRVLALRHRLPEASLAKLLRLLSQAGIIESSAGTRGGYRLSRAPDRISLLEIYMAVRIAGPPGRSPRTPDCCLVGSPCPSLIVSEEASALLQALLAGKTLQEFQGSP